MTADEKLIVELMEKIAVVTTKLDSTCDKLDKTISTMSSKIEALEKTMVSKELCAISQRNLWLKVVALATAISSSISGGIEAIKNYLN